MNRLAMCAAFVALFGLCGIVSAGHKAAPKAGATTQSAQAKENHKNLQQQIKAVLTADQLKILDDAKGKGPEARKAANQQVRASLTADQKAKIKEIRQSIKPQADGKGAGKGHGKHKSNAASQPAVGA